MNYNINIDPEIKTQAENTFAELGFGLSEAIELFLRASIKNPGFPLEVRELRPKPELLTAIEETEQIIKEYENGMRKPKPYASAREFLQEILDEEDDDV